MGGMPGGLSGQAEGLGFGGIVERPRGAPLAAPADPPAETVEGSGGGGGNGCGGSGGTGPLRGERERARRGGVCGARAPAGCAGGAALTAAKDASSGLRGPARGRGPPDDGEADAAGFGGAEGHLEGTDRPEGPGRSGAGGLGAAEEGTAGEPSLFRLCFTPPRWPGRIFAVRGAGGCLAVAFSSGGAAEGAASGQPPGDGGAGSARTTEASLATRRLTALRRRAAGPGL